MFWIATHLPAGTSQWAARAFLGAQKGAPVTRYSAIALVLIAASSANAAEKVLDKTFTVSPGGTLVVDADSASVRVSGNDTNAVVVHMSARGSEDDLATTRLDAVQKDGGVTVTMRRDEKRHWFSWRSWNSDERIEVTVPRHYEISVRTGGGSVDLADTTGGEIEHFWRRPQREERQRQCRIANVRGLDPCGRDQG
jgi:hypothetical protein